MNGIIGMTDLALDTPLTILVVCDTGIGIPEDKQTLIFEPFRQVDGSSARRYPVTSTGRITPKSGKCLRRPLVYLRPHYDFLSRSRPLYASNLPWNRRVSHLKTLRIHDRRGQYMLPIAASLWAKSQ